jgi:hypothetical protein
MTVVRRIGRCALYASCELYATCALCGPVDGHTEQTGPDLEDCVPTAAPLVHVRVRLMPAQPRPVAMLHASCVWAMPLHGMRSVQARRTGKAAATSNDGKQSNHGTPA